MKKNCLFKAVAFVMATLMLFSFVGCGDQGGSKTGSDTAEASGESAGKAGGKWTMEICGKKVTLPCTVEELLDSNITMDKNSKKEISAAENETFKLVPVVCNETGTLYLKVKAGSDSSKELGNATILSIANSNTAKSDVFQLKNGIAIGSKVDDVIDTFGKDYEITSATDENDLTQGFAIMRYMDGEDFLLIHFRAGEVVYIEVQVGEE